MAQLSNADYNMLESFIQTALNRLIEGKATALSTHEDIMYPLTAWDRGNAQEFIPWIKITMNEWAQDDAS